MKLNKKTQTHARATYLILIPMDFLKACVKASVLLISNEKISLPAMAVNGVSVPSDCAIPITYKTDKRLVAETSKITNQRFVALNYYDEK